ncbi:MAG: GEVED domain-containing protein [Pseudomonadales bacterium]|nr:GEVED domain-containing protein [Pseudomonadales bacterium]
MKTRLMLTRLLRMAVLMTMGLAQTTVAAVSIPSSSLLYLQTSGQARTANIGDWYTSSQTGSTDRVHRFNLFVSEKNLTDGGGAVTVTIVDAESNGNLDEVSGTPDPTRFELRDEAGGLIQSRTLNSGTADGTDVVFTLTAAGSYQVTSVTGAIPINGDTSTTLNDDDNSFSLLLSEGELIGQLQGTFQHSDPATQSFDFYFVVGPGTNSISVRNFDADNRGQVRYYSPGGAVTNGTVSGNGVWNAGGTVDVGADQYAGLDTTPDASCSASSDVGIWRVQYSGWNASNQVAFEVLKDGQRVPLTETPSPQFNGSFTLEQSGAKDTTVNAPVLHPLVITNGSFASDLINLELSAVPTGFTAQLLDSSGNVLTDSDGNGEPDTGILQPGETLNLNLRVTPAPEATGPATLTVTGRSYLSICAGTANNDPRTVSLVTHVLDLGDAPDAAPGTAAGDYATSLADNGPRHRLQATPQTYLGTVPPDADGAAPQSADALGDDQTGSDDEDALILDGRVLDGQAFPLGSSQDLEVVISGPGYLNLWMDLNGDGDFADTVGGVSEQLVVDRDLSANAGTNTVTETIAVPAGAQEGPSLVRARYCSTPGSCDSAQGLAADGEVEDYAVSIGARPFQCSNTLFQIATPTSQLRRIDFTGTSASFVDVGPGAGMNVNAGWGFNDQDGFIYGMRSGRNEMWMVDALGYFYQLASPTGLPGNRNGSNAGDVLPDGRMIYKTANNRLTVLDLTTSPASFVRDISLSQSVNFIDLAYNPIDQHLYAIDNNSDRLFWVDIATGAVTFFGPTHTGAFGAHWFDEDGRFYVYDNTTNELSYIDVGFEGDGSGQRILLSTSTNDEGGINDGAFCRGEAPIPLGGIAGVLFADTNGSDARDNGENGLGAGIKVDLYRDNGTPNNLADDVYVGSEDTLPGGSYAFNVVLAGQTYRVEVDTSDGDIPPGYFLGTPSPLTGVFVNVDAVTSGIDFGFDFRRIVLSGQIFDDNGAGASQPHDGLKAGDEAGLADLVVTLFSDSDGDGVCAATDPQIATARTAGDGRYQLVLEPIWEGQSACLVAQTPNGYLSVNESDGGHAAVTAGDGDDDVMALVIPDAGDTLAGLDFADVGKPVLEPDRQGVVDAGGSLFYSHRFTARTAGAVDFTLGAAQTSPATPPWSDTLYRDADCDGDLDPGEASLPLGAVNVLAGDSLCLLVKVFAPADAPLDALHSRPLLASQTFFGTALQSQVAVLDTTRLSAGTLTLEKRVRNIGPDGLEGTADDVDTQSGTVNQAAPGDVLRYRLVFSNQGVRALTEVTVNDSTPAYSRLYREVACPASLPAALTGCSVTTADGSNASGYEGAVQWLFSGQLLPGNGGEVVYDVQVSP